MKKVLVVVLQGSTISQANFQLEYDFETLPRKGEKLYFPDEQGDHSVYNVIGVAHNYNNQVLQEIVYVKFIARYSDYVNMAL